MKWLKPPEEFGELVGKVLNITQDASIDTGYFVHHAPVRNVTIQLTEDCNCACTYCYQGHKTKRKMTKETGKDIIDYLFKLWYENENEGFINQKDTKGIILDFIGGEPLLNIEVADYICEYFWSRCILENHPWQNYWSASFSSNGSLYFSEAFQKYLQKYKGHVSYSVTVDGPKEIHDACRIYADGSGGNFDDAIKAMLDYKGRTYGDPGTKVTISPENLSMLGTIVNFFFDNDVYSIHANIIYEHNWTEEESREYYQQLKKLADDLFERNHDAYVALFDENHFAPLDPTNTDNNRNACGGAGAMLAFNPDGIAYPCLRYMESSLGKDQPPIIIGNCKTGIYNTEETKKILEDFSKITRRSQSTDECYNCEIAGGCSWCSAWNYQETGSVNIRSTNICNMHKARSLANVYFWNKFYINENIPKTFHRYLSDNEALKFISQSELELLNDLEKQTLNKMHSLEAMD